MSETKQRTTNPPHEQIVATTITAPEWWTLRQCCERKGLSYKSACNRTTLQPNRGKPDGYLNGRKVWHRATVEEWLVQLDGDIEQGGGYA